MFKVEIEAFNLHAAITLLRLDYPVSNYPILNHTITHGKFIFSIKEVRN